MGISLNSLPPAMRKQAIRKMMEEDRNAAALGRSSLSTRKKEAAENGPQFDSYGERDYYYSVVMPKVRRGEIVKYELHPSYELFKASEHMGVTFGRIRYTPDFRLEYADGTVEIVEIKSRFVKKMQRDYPVRRRVFVEKYAIPNGWKFTEVITDEKEKAADVSE